MSRPVKISVCTVRAMSAGVALLFCGTLVHADWIDWWRTPAQQAEAALDSGDIDKLKSIAPDALWKGVAEYAGGEFDAAAQSFNEDATERLASGQMQAANQALYNRGVSEALNEQYENAVQSFNQVLEADPQFADALHNRDIAMQLMQQQQQQESQDGDEQDSDESSDSDEQSESSPDGEQPSQEGEPGESSEQQDAQSGDEGQEEQDAQDTDADSEEQRRQDEQAAQDALAAEEQATGGGPSEQDEERDSEGTQQMGAEETEQPLSESEQATEQWLRRIPDDPAGLLRRKLQQSHQLEYPEVRDAQQPW